MLPELKDEDIAIMLAALAGGTGRVQRVSLSDRDVWIKRYNRLGFRLGQRFLWGLSRLIRQPVLRPTPVLDGEGMLEREVRQIERFSAAGFLTPAILYK